jgi:hypothetical protein
MISCDKTVGPSMQLVVHCPPYVTVLGNEQLFFL